MKKYPLLIFLLFAGTTLFAQAKTTQSLLWLRYQMAYLPQHNTKVNAEYDTRFFFDRFSYSQSVIRIGVNYYPVKLFDVYGGFALFLNGPAQATAVYNPIPELRPELGFGFTHKAGPVGLYHRFKTDFRFVEQIQDGKLINKFSYSSRFRYQLNLSVPLVTKKEKAGSTSLKLMSEIMVHTGKLINKSYYDQSRGYAGLNIDVIKDILSIEPGYLFIHQKRVGKQEYFYRHILRITLAQKF